MDSNSSLPKRLRVLSWNLDGLDPRFLPLRTAAAGSEILERGADCVLLQEVTESTLPALRYRLQSAGYTVSVPPTSGSYFCLLATRPKIHSKGYTPFTGSNMGRGLLWAEVDWAGSRLLLMTAHLESLRDSSTERVRQLHHITERLSEHTGPAVFAGDTNLRDAEVRGVNVQDVWTLIGSPEESRYTWDMSRVSNKRTGKGRARMRFDRMFINDWPGWGGAGLALIGTTPLGEVARGLHPSDHFGLLAVLSGS
jgi:tyrosyl-DNA phosphodiesterase 2